MIDLTQQDKDLLQEIFIDASNKLKEEQFINYAEESCRASCTGTCGTFILNE